MATIIAARKPEYNEQFGSEFNWWTTINYKATPFATSTLLIIKRSPSATQSVDLRLNVSPLAKDFFRHTPELTTPVHIVAPLNHKDTIEVSLANNGYGIGTFASYEAYDGWIPYLSNVIASTDVTKKAFRDTPAYISGKPFSCNNIRWLLSDGTDVVVSNNFQTTETSVTFPVIHSNLTITDAHTGITVIGRSNTNDELWRLEYEFTCPYDEANTIGFINKYGVWEFIDVDGRKQTELKTDRSTYTRYSDGQKQDFNVRGDYEYDFNTGWVNRGFEDVMEQLMLSENVILYKGDGTTPMSLVIDSNSIDIQDSRADKMVNYNFKAMVSKPIIPII